MKRDEENQPSIPTSSSPIQNLKFGQPIIDGYHRSGRKRVEIKLPNLLEDIKSLVDLHTQTILD